MKRAVVTAVACAVALLLLATPALSSWLAAGAGAGHSAAGQLSATTDGAAGSATASSLRLTWSYAPTGLAPGGWQILRGSSDVSATCTYEAGALACVDSGLSASTTYDYSVRAVLGSWRGAATTFRATTAAAPLAVTTASLPEGTVQTPYSHTMTAGGGTSPYTWTTSAPLPKDLSMSAGGVISGTPKNAATVQVVFTVTDAAGRTASKELTLRINGAGQK